MGALPPGNHSVELVRIPDKISVIEGGAVVMPFALIETDRRSRAFVDLFALAHCYLYQVLPSAGTSAPGRAGPDPDEAKPAGQPRSP